MLTATRRASSAVRTFARRAPSSLSQGKRRLQRATNVTAVMNPKEPFYAPKVGFPQCAAPGEAP